ncbi:MAG: hypothetical protein CIT01_00670 [Methanobacterium sp. BRmetb2]|nr:MAG: hypothetical protein CIT01_00670 [Methanobacterium sp. BRmetb2]
MANLIFDEMDFIKEAEILKIDYKKYVRLKISQIENLKQIENFIKLKTVKSSSIQMAKIVGDRVEDTPEPEDTYYYFDEGNYAVVLIESYSNLKPKNPDEKLEKFMILPHEVLESKK